MINTFTQDKKVLTGTESYLDTFQDVDPNGNIVLNNFDDPFEGLFVITEVTAVNGTVDFRSFNKDFADPDGDGIFEPTGAQQQSYEYTPNEGFTGFDVVTYTLVNQTTGETLQVTQNVEVVQANTNIQYAGDFATIIAGGSAENSGSLDLVNYIDADGTYVGAYFPGTNSSTSVSDDVWSIDDSRLGNLAVDGTLTFTAADLLQNYTTVNGAELSVANVALANQWDSGGAQSYALEFDASTGTYTAQVPNEAFANYTVSFDIVDPTSSDVFPRQAIQIFEDGAGSGSGPTLTGEQFDFGVLYSGTPKGFDSRSFTDEALLVGYTDADGSNTNSLRVKNLSIDGVAFRGEYSNILNETTGESEYYLTSFDLGSDQFDSKESVDLEYTIVDESGNELQVSRTVQFTEYQQGSLVELYQERAADGVTITRELEVGAPGNTLATVFSNNAVSGETIGLSNVWQAFGQEGDFRTESNTFVDRGIGYIDEQGNLVPVEVESVVSSNGATIVQDESGTWLYTAPEGFTGFDQYTITYSGNGQSISVSYTVEVLPNSTATNDTIVASEALSDFQYAESQSVASFSEGIFPFGADAGGDLFVEDANAAPESVRFNPDGTIAQTFGGNGYIIQDNTTTRGYDSYSVIKFDQETFEQTVLDQGLADYDGGKDFSFNESQILDLYTSTDGDPLELVNVEFYTFADQGDGNFAELPVEVSYDSATGTYTRQSDGSDEQFIQTIFIRYEVSDGSGVNTPGQEISIFSSSAFNNSITLSDTVTEATTYTVDQDTFELLGPESTDLDAPIQASESYTVADNVLADAVAGQTYTVSAELIRSLFTDSDGDAIDLKEDLFGSLNLTSVVGTPEEEALFGSLTYDAATDSFSADISMFEQAGQTSFEVGVNAYGGIDFAYAGFKVDITDGSSPVVEKGVEGQDFLYANALPENRDNDAIKKRGEDLITGHYWVNSRDSSLNDNLVDGGEYAVIMGRRGELTSDLTADEIIGGLESGDFVATKSFTSYGGYAVNAAFADGQIDSLVESANPNIDLNLSIGRIDANTGELLTGFAGAIRNIDGSEVWDNFDPSRSLSGRNDNAFGGVLEQQSQTGGF